MSTGRVANAFLVPHGITIDPANNVFLTDLGLQRVFEFTHNGKPLLTLGEPRVGAWECPVISNQPMFRFVRMERSTCRTAIVTAIGFGQPGAPVFNAVHDIAVGKDGSIYVAETRTRRVVKLRPVK